MGKGSRRPLAVGAFVLALLTAVAFIAAITRSDGAASTESKLAQKLLQRSGQGPSEPNGSESAELIAAQQQWDNQRTQGSVVAPGAYTAALGSLEGLPSAGGSWYEITRLPYDADDPDYRDYYSNSSLGSGLVTGRVTGLAADSSGYVYAAGADGGIWRSSTGGGRWTPIADRLPTLSSGDLELAPDGSLWYATGEANTGGTSYVGTGVYRLATPRTGAFERTDRVGGPELESTTIHSLRFANGKVWAATLRGIYSHPLGSYTTPWTRVWSPQPSFLPGGANAGAQNAAYMNIVNDLVVDPTDSDHMLAAAGWRSGAAYNGFYESRDGGATWTRINPSGGIDASDIGYANFAFAGDGKTLYVINQSPRKLNSLGFQQTLLDGVYQSKHGLAGPWNLIANSGKLGSTSSGSALANVLGQGYSPGIQAWYNQFITVDPADPQHVFVGLEEVYETRDGGSSWTTIGPYWNYGMPCWRPDALYPPNGSGPCPQTTHSDQHAIAFGVVGGKQTMVVGNDGGVYKRPLNGSVNANGNATDWVSLNDGTIDSLQYYYVGVGKLDADDAKRPDLQSGDGVLVSGGLQDNGGSLVRPGGAKMVSNFGGDGGDVLVDPNDGCNIVQEYVVLSMRVTRTCANPGNPDAFLDLSKSTTIDISPPDINAQFIAPFTANEKNIDQWLAGGNSIWYQDKGFGIKSSSQWQKVKTLASPAQTFTAVAYSGNKAVATWCGPCSNSTAATFARGATVGTYAGGTWTWKDVTFSPTFPNRFLQGAAINPNDSNDMFIVVNGFSRRFSEGPGAGVGHVFESKDGGTTWTDISANFPDIPSSDILALASGGLVVATDLGVVYRAPGATNWSRLGPNLPLTAAMDLTLGPDEKIYVATHGRGIWRIPARGL
jgi:sugar lactone lactonase YvrE